MALRFVVGRWLARAMAVVVSLLLAFGLGAGLFPSPAAAAEVLQVRSATLLQVGDQNRSYSVALSCLALPAADEAAATVWLRAAVPRRTRVNLRPMGADGGILMARVVRLDQGTDLAADLVAAGYGQLSEGCGP